MVDRIEMVGRHKLILGDGRVVLQQRNEALVFDPPYLLQTKGGGKFRKARPMLNTIAAEQLDEGFDLAMLSWERAHSIVVFCSNDQLSRVMTRLEQGFHRVVCCQWHKENPSPMANKHYLADTEFYVHAWQHGAHPLGQHGDKKRHISTTRFVHDFDHPTVKPPKVMAKIMANVNADTVTDPYMGTGSTGVAAHAAGKTFVGYEINPKHFETALRRMRAAVEGG